MPRSPLWENAEFVADILSDQRKKDVMAKWGVSSGLVVEARKRLGGNVDTARARPGGVDGIVSSGSTEGPDGKTFEFVRNRPITLADAREWIRSSGDNPDLFYISISANSYGDGQSSNKMVARPKAGKDLMEALPLEQLYREAARPRSGKVFSPHAAERGTVVNIADPQIGKTGRRGGTPALLARLADKRGLLYDELLRRAPDRILLGDLGDGIEGFESGGNPMFTNDLSLPDQLDCYATEMFKFVALACEFAPVDVAVVPSNHAAWRKGKQTLGNPSDDFGIYVHKQVEKVAQAAGLDATWHYPKEYDESVRVDLLGVPIGFVHGNQFGPNAAIQWWEKQAFGGQAITHCDIAISGHYHSYGAGVAGTNPMTGRERMWLGCPTLDNGSDWFRNIAGRDSEPGLLIFDVTPEGLDLGSLNIL